MIHSLVAVLEKLHSLNIGWVRVEFTQTRKQNRESIFFETRTEPMLIETELNQSDRLGSVGLKRIMLTPNVGQP